MLSTSDGNRGLLACFRIFIDDDDDDELINNYWVSIWPVKTKNRCRHIANNIIDSVRAND